MMVRGSYSDTLSIHVLHCWIIHSRKVIVLGFYYDGEEDKHRSINQSCVTLLSNTLINRKWIVLGYNDGEREPQRYNNQSRIILFFSCYTLWLKNMKQNFKIPAKIKKLFPIKICTKTIHLSFCLCFFYTIISLEVDEILVADCVSTFYA